MRTLFACPAFLTLVIDFSAAVPLDRGSYGLRLQNSAGEIQARASFAQLDNRVTNDQGHVSAILQERNPRKDDPNPTPPPNQEEEEGEDELADLRREERDAQDDVRDAEGDLRAAREVVSDSEGKVSENQMERYMFGLERAEARLQQAEDNLERIQNRIAELEG